MILQCRKRAGKLRILHNRTFQAGQPLLADCWLHFQVTKSVSYRFFSNHSKYRWISVGGSTAGVALLTWSCHMLSPLTMTLLYYQSFAIITINHYNLVIDHRKLAYNQPLQMIKPLLPVTMIPAGNPVSCGVRRCGEGLDGAGTLRPVPGVGQPASEHPGVTGPQHWKPGENRPPCWGSL